MILGIQSSLATSANINICLPHFLQMSAKDSQTNSTIGL